MDRLSLKWITVADTEMIGSEYARHVGPLLQRAQVSWDASQETPPVGYFKDGITNFFASLYRERLEKIEPGCFDKLVALNNASVDQSELGWLCELALQGRLKTEDHYKARDYLAALSRKPEPEGTGNSVEHRPFLSPVTFRDLPALYRFVKDKIPGSSREGVGAERELLISVGEIETIHESDALRIYRPSTERASQNLGIGSQWCVSASNDCLFDKYNLEGPLFFVFPKGEEPVLLHFASLGFWDATNDVINWHEFLERFPILGTIGAWHLADKHRPMADFLLNAHPDDSTVFRALCWDTKTVTELTRARYDTPMRLGQQITDFYANEVHRKNFEQTLLNASIEYVGAIFSLIFYYKPENRELESIQILLQKLPRENPLRCFSDAIQRAVDIDTVRYGTIRPLIRDFVFLDPEREVTNNYVTIERYPGASLQLQQVAFRAAQEALRRIEKAAPQNLPDSAKRAKHAFSNLRNPSREILAWLNSSAPLSPVPE